MANQACISIGINQYQFLPPLSYAMADAVAMEQFFIDTAGWEADQSLLLTDMSPQNHNKSTYPDRENINRWLKQWSWDKLQHGDLLWFFFSGCGVSFGNEDYLLPIDGKVEDLANTGISVRQLYRQLHDIGVNALVFLDANRAQHLSLGGGIGKVTARLAQEYQIPTFVSCQGSEFSHEDAGLGHGLFTAALLEAIAYHPDLNLKTIDIYLTTRLAELSEHHWKPLQTPMSIVPTGVSTHRPVFSATTQSAISATIPEVVYTPPAPTALEQDDVYEPDRPPTISISIPAPIGTGEIVKKLPSTSVRKQVSHWAKVSTLLTLMVAAGGGIYAFKSRSPELREPQIVRTVLDRFLNARATNTATSVSAEQISTASEAKLFVKPGDATSRYQAILAARKIPTTTPAATAEVQQSIELWSQEIYHIAQGYADRQRWQLAIDTAKMVPKDAPNYLDVKTSMSAWRNKLSVRD